MDKGTTRFTAAETCRQYREGNREDARTSSIESDTNNKKPDVLSEFGFNNDGMKPW
jgi:hypothetical protein